MKIKEKTIWSPTVRFRGRVKLIAFSPGHLACWASLHYIYCFFFFFFFLRVHEHTGPVLQHLFNVLPHWFGHLAGLLPASLLQGQEVDWVIKPSLLPPWILASRTSLGHAWQKASYQQHHQGTLELSCQNWSLCYGRTCVTTITQEVKEGLLFNLVGFGLVLQQDYY